MSREREIDALTAERLLAGEAIGLDRLENLLAAAAAPGRPGELAGEQAAVVSLRQAVALRQERFAHPISHRARRRRATMAGRGARLLGVKVAALAVAVAGVGVAFAAGVGVLPNPLDLSSSPVDGRSTLAGRLRSDGAGVGGTRSVPVGAPTSLAALDPSFVGLCEAYVAQVTADPGKASDSPAFTALVTAAGGTQRVVVLCERLLSERGASQDPGKASTHPTGPPSDHPTSKATKSATHGSPGS